MRLGGEWTSLTLGVAARPRGPLTSNAKELGAAFLEALKIGLAHTSVKLREELVYFGYFS